MSALKLKGQFTIQTYGPDGFEKSKKVIPNFITSTGLSFPYSIPLGECFKQLTIGSGIGINTVLTTGMESGNIDYANLVNYVSDACGTINTNSGVSLFRAWRIPFGESVVNDYPLSIAELGVHPTDLGVSSSGYLFSRVLPNVVIDTGDYSVITYSLNIGLPTGIKSFYGIINSSLVNTSDSPVCRYWNRISGRYSVIHHGLNTIGVDGLIREESFKSPLEPSNRSTSALKAYLSTDNKQFIVNSYSGGAIDTASFQPYTAEGLPFGTGLCSYHREIAGGLETRLVDIRKGTFKIPLNTDFRLEGDSSSEVKVNSLTTITQDSYIATGRTRSLVRLFSWPNAQNLFEDVSGNPNKIKSLVLSQSVYGSHYPYCDVIFSTSGASELNYSVDTDNHTYDPNSLTGNYAFIDPFDNLSLSFRLSWGSDCPDSVSGCPGYTP